jgi:hypothetical protein
MAPMTAGTCGRDNIPPLKGGGNMSRSTRALFVVNLSRPVEFCPAMCRGEIGYRDEMGRISQNAFCPGKLHRMGEINFVPVSLERSRK